MLARPRGVLLPLLLAVGGAAACGTDADGAPEGRPDILLVSIDSLRPDHLGCYGYDAPTSPTIDGLAREGILFTDAVSTTSWTLPAHAALFTGLYDSSHGLTDNGLRLGDEHATLAELLRDAGYRTAGFYGGPYLHPTFGLDQGFEVYESCMTNVPESWGGDEIRAESSAKDSPSHADVTGPRTVERVSAWLETLPPQGERPPFFLFVHLWDVHYDYVAPAEYVERFDPGYEGDVDGVGFITNPAISADMDPRDLQHVRALYDAEIRFTDDTLHAILAAVARNTDYRKLLVVVTADHGEEFFEHGRKGHRKTLYDEVVRVPLVLRWPPELAARTRIDEQVRLIDVMPTLARAAGAELPVEVEGRDLLVDGRLPPEPALLELLAGGDGRLRGLRTEAGKVLVVGPGQYLLYDLREDPGEQHPIVGGSGVDDERVARAASELRHVRKAAVAFRDGLGKRAVERVELDPGVRERLRGLGYLGDDASSDE